MFKCLNEKCGHIFESGEQISVTEDYGQTFDYCPICRTEFEEAKRCEICDRYTCESELIDGIVCEECFEKYSTDLDACYKVGKEEKVEVKINSLLGTMYSDEEIEAILYEHAQEMLSKNPEYKDRLKEFANNDKEWFAAILTEVL